MEVVNYFLSSVGTVKYRDVLILTNAKTVCDEVPVRVFVLSSLL
jgi:multisubunit Na+/H+ antiporter MnhG subunit